ncbi:DNA-binding protein RIF1 LALA0_S10e04654g [Lachancea lanzarotensis]|uniref:LALA0S10e04654g1_1 n=1 Tax=Lachancea lanzarotensis TaxID=1245769 RepID=A0A0C7N8H0_9SACH|nr:uncharacterized protein LALA0_S10e04654g [Lachancea lanzarotensis]CEP64195.1 LALA0S10e04654g1_1 [Lachancea lanzarotensis]
MDQSAGNLNKNGRALDVLEKHISQHNKRAKTSNYGALSSMWQTISDSSRITTSPKKTLRQSRDSSPSRKHEKYVFLTPTDPLEAKDTRKLRSSPLRKSVTFSDNIESSPPQEQLDSSPRSFSQARPSKSILKLTDSPVMKVSPRRNRKAHARPASEHLELDSSENGGSNPLNIDFWVCGEVHSLHDINSVAEFKALLTGGLYFMSSALPTAHERLFELYATLNNIMPAYVHHTHFDVKDKKLSIVINNIDLVLSTCTPHLIEHQSALLETQKKDPFVSRTYVQIVRFLSFIFSSFRIVEACKDKSLFQSSYQKVVACCIETMGHSYSNKVMITAQLAFLRDEQVGLLRNSELNVSSVIQALIKMKKIESSNLICEKLLLLKKFVSRYTDVMFETVDIWLTTEVLSRLLPNQQFYSSKIASICVSILLDLLKRSLTESTHPNVYSALTKPIKDLEVSLDSEYKNSQKRSKMGQKSTVSQLLLQSVEYLLTEKSEHKLAFDLWLSMVGLLFNSTSELDELCSDPMNEWLLLNLKHQNAGVHSVSGLALRSWRIVTYVICTKSVPSPKNARQVDVLLEPFSPAQFESRTLDDGDDDIFLLRGILYLALCNHQPDAFSHNFKNIIKPLLLRISDSHETAGVGFYTLQMLSSLCQPSKIENDFQRDFNSLKVIASPGLGMDDFLHFSSQIFDLHWDMLFKTALKLNRLADVGSLESSFNFLASTIRNTPKQLIRKEVIDMCLKSLSDALECSNQNIHCRVIHALSCSMIAFNDNMWMGFKSNVNLKKVVKQVVRHNDLSILEILKGVVESTKGLVPDLEIYDYFLSFEDKYVETYISNSVCSKIRSSEMSNSTFNALLNIAESISDEHLAENVMGICDKLRRDLGYEEHQIMMACDLPTLFKYLRLRLSLQTETIDPTFITQFTAVLKNHNQLKFELHRALDNKHYTSLVLQALILESRRYAGTAGAYIEAWRPVLSNYPLSELDNALKQVEELAVDFGLCFILRALETDIIHNSTLSSCLKEKFMSLPLDGQRNSSDSNTLEFQFLQKCYDTQSFSLLNEAIKRFILSGLLLPVVRFWRDSSEKDANVLDAEALVLLVSDVGGDDRMDYKVVKNRLNQSYDFALSVIEAALKYRKDQILIELKENFAALLLDCTGKLKNSELRVKDALKKASPILIVPDNKAIDPALQMLFRSLPAREGTLAYEQLAIVCSSFKNENRDLDKIRELLDSGAPDLTLQPYDGLAPKSKSPRLYHFKAVPKKCATPEPLKTSDEIHNESENISEAHTSEEAPNRCADKVSDQPTEHGLRNKKEQITNGQKRLSSSEYSKPLDSTENLSSASEERLLVSVNCDRSSSPQSAHKRCSSSAVKNSVSDERSLHEAETKVEEDGRDLSSVRDVRNLSTLQSDWKLSESSLQDPIQFNVTDDVRQMKRQSDLKLPIYKMSATKETTSNCKTTLEAFRAPLPSSDARDDTSERTLSAVSKTNQAPNTDVDDLSILNGVLPSDKQTKMIVQIVKQFGKEEFSQLTQAQKSYLKDAVVKFVAKLGSGESKGR